MAADVYELFRLSLAVRRPDDLFSDLRPDRQNYIAEIFGIKIDFDHYGTPFAFVPLHIDALTGVIVGKIGRAITTLENAPPEQDFDETLRTAWKALVIVIDPRPTNSGQKIGIQIDRKVGKPTSVIRTMLKTINAQPNTPYVLDANAIITQESFWDFAKRHQGNIVSLTFEFVVPNGIWNADSHLKDELRSAHTSMNAQEIVTTVKSETGIRTDSKPVADALNYIEAGSGTAKAKTRDGEIFVSTRRAMRTSILFDPLSAPRNALARALVGLSKIIQDE